MADNTNDLSPFTQAYSEVHENRLLMRIRPGNVKPGDANTAAHVAYWDSMTGGGFKRNISKRARPGQKFKAKVPGLGIDIDPITLKRAWNTTEEQRQPLEPMLGQWLSGKDTITGFIITVEKLLMQDDGTLKLIDSYTGPVSGYEPPMGNTDSENFATESLTIDPSDYIGPDSMNAKPATTG